MLKKPSIALPLPAFSMIIIFVILMVIGGALTPLLSVKLHPSRTSDGITIYFNWPKAAAGHVEREVTAKLEGVLSTVKGIQCVRSISSNEVGYIHADLDDNSNINQCRYEISTLIKQVFPALPPGVSYPSVKVDRPDEKANSSVLTYNITGRNSAFDIQEFAANSITPKLSLIKGVYQINTYGASPFAWELKYHTADFIRYNISASEISGAISRYFQSYELGQAFVVNDIRRKGPTYNYLTLKTSHSTPVKWNEIPIKKAGGKLLYLTDLVKVGYAEQEPNSFYRINGLNTLNLEVIAGKTSNFLVLADAVKKQVEHIKSNLPDGYSIIPVYDATEYLKVELDKAIWRSIVTIIILLVCVLMISHSFRYLFFILISLVCNILVAFIFYYFLDLEINLYSLAGITLSFGVIIDNSVVVIDHVSHKNNLRILVAVVGATSTTIGAVCIIFFLDARHQADLLDFAWVVIINLCISLVIAIFFIPAIMEKLPLPKTNVSKVKSRMVKAVLWNKFYTLLINTVVRFKGILALAVIFVFGIPIFMLPLKIEKKNYWSKVYNSTFGSDFYNNAVRPWADKTLGGTLRLFLAAPQRFSNPPREAERTRLRIKMNMPAGVAIQKMNNLAIEWEKYLSQFEQVQRYQTHVYSGQSAEIDILFKPNADKTSFPLFLKTKLEEKAVYTGLADFIISGAGQAFDNNLNIEHTNYGLTILGYDYVRLTRLAEKVKELLSQNPRVEKIYTGSTRDEDGEKLKHEFVFRINNNEKLLGSGFSPRMIRSALNRYSIEGTEMNSIIHGDQYIPVLISPVDRRASVWQISNDAIRLDSGAYIRLKELGIMDQERTDDEILRENQQYQIVVNYNFVGDGGLGTLVSQQVINQVKAILPLGYSVRVSDEGFWTGSKKQLTWAIFFTVGIVFVICGILLNSIYQPLVVLSIIPISFIGVFLTEYFFKYRFDEGGYASLIVLCGISVNSALFILNDYNSLRRRYPQRSEIKLFLKAYNSKIVPVILSTFSMILGLLTLLIYSKDDLFWYALAMSTIGGLVFSMIAVILFLPLLLRKRGSTNGLKSVLIQGREEL